MRTSLGFLAAAALCLGAASGAHAQGIQFTPFQTNNSPIQYSPFSVNGPQIHQPFSSGSTTPTPPQGASQATFPAPGRLLAGPSRLINLLPNVGGISNTHYIGSSVIPSDTNQYLGLFGYKRLR
jgi:hypothetical protein